ncbi:MAG: hypothetical protein OJF59_001606 [Cytophagales bacterium]|jgi:hypothetical protein|nr:DUF4199 domain-containing protein [Bacteroidota bacterium]WHZ07853.1 MAG: hypothetical protein OJF59_001606 [Cytophagales bacterium]
MMKFTKNLLFIIPFRFGLIGGLIGSLAIMVLFYLGRHPFLIPVIFDFRIVIYAMFIFITLKVLRDNYLNGSLLFWQGMTGSYVFLVTAALTGALSTFCLAIAQNGFLTGYIGAKQQQMTDFKKEFIDELGAAMYQQQLSKLADTTAFDLAIDYFLKSLVIGLFLTIIISVILRKQKQTQ